MGVNLDQKKGNLYRTYGVDFYRRNLKSIVKGNSQRLVITGKHRFLSPSMNGYEVRF